MGKTKVSEERVEGLGAIAARVGLSRATVLKRAAKQGTDRLPAHQEINRQWWAYGAELDEWVREELGRLRTERS